MINVNNTANKMWFKRYQICGKRVVVTSRKRNVKSVPEREYLKLTSKYSKLSYKNGIK